MKKLIGPFSQILTMDQLPLKGPLSDDQLPVLSNSAIAVEDGRILEIGSWEDLIPKYEFKYEINEIHQPAVLLPGFIDAHTHICYGGSRRRDYAMRVAGKSYLDIAKSGGGIWDTVQKTRGTSQNDLVNGIIERSDVQLKNGITTCEVKSGYGLSVKEELKMLRAIKAANNFTGTALIATCLAAHIKPHDFNGTSSEYLDLIIHELFPLLITEKLSSRIDIFIEDSAFNRDESNHYLKAAKQAGFDITVHADQFHTGGSAIGVANQAISVDHLEASTDKEISLIAASNTIATALPGASIGLGEPFAPARKLLDRGACLAIASDWNPGSAPMGDLLAQASILGAYEKLTTAETLAGITYRAAAALSKHDRGILKESMHADMVAFATEDYRDILYHQGRLRPLSTWKNGKRIQ